MHTNIQIDTKIILIIVAMSAFRSRGYSSLWKTKRADGGSRTEAVRAVAHDDGRDVVLLVGETPAYFTWWFTKRIATNSSTRKKTTKPARMPIDWDKQHRESCC